MKPICNRRRAFGVIFISLAGAQLVLGETLLKGQLSPATTLFYWGLCLLSTFAAIVCALSDALQALRQSRHDRRQLLNNALRQIESDLTTHEGRRHRPRNSR